MSTPSLVDLAMARVREHIRANNLKVGDALPGEGRFATELGVSRAVMREAFGALAALGQIDVANGRRARVGAMDGTVMGSSIDHAIATAQISVGEVWEVRRTLECRTVALAAEHRSDEQAERIQAAARAMIDAPDQRTLSRADIAFHHAISEASGNILFHQIVRSFGQLMEVAVPTAWQTRQTGAQRADILAVHCTIAEAVMNRDPQSAITAMDRHFDKSIGDLMRFQSEVA